MTGKWSEINAAWNFPNCKRLPLRTIFRSLIFLSELFPIAENTSSGNFVHDVGETRLYTMHDEVRLHESVYGPGFIPLFPKDSVCSGEQLPSPRKGDMVGEVVQFRED